METVTIPLDIKLFYVTAISFPDGIMQAHEKLHAKVPYSKNRRFYGLSRPENGQIIYLAAAEELTAGEALKFNCPEMVLKSGTYICITIMNYLQQVHRISQSFQQLLVHPGIDPEGYCVEWYFSENDVKCMVRLVE